MTMSPTQSSDSGTQSGDLSRSYSRDKNRRYSKSPSMKSKKTRILYIKLDTSDESSSSGCDEGSSSSDEQDYNKVGVKRSKMSKVSTSSDEEYAVEEIVDVKGRKKKWYYVKWQNYDSSENTWEPEKNLENCKEELKKFWDKRNKDKSSRTKVKETDNDLEPARKRKYVKSAEPIIPAKNKSKSVKVSLKNCISNLPKRQASASSQPRNERGLLERRTQNRSNCQLFFFRVLIGEQEDYIAIDLDNKNAQRDAVYNCIITEDVTGKDVKFLYGAVDSFNGDILCLVQFERHRHVDLVPPNVLFARFPGYKKFFQLLCPKLFPSNG